MGGMAYLGAQRSPSKCPSPSRRALIVAVATPAHPYFTRRAPTSAGQALHPTQPHTQNGAFDSTATSLLSPLPPVASRNSPPKSPIPSTSGQNAPQIQKVSQE
jgi:hypothetical protein